jgi:glycosyltransferase involved in cell wall biosynthesis
VPRRIALVCDYPPDHVTFTGGVQTATAALLEGLRQHQAEFEFHLVSLSTSIPADVHEQRNGFYFHFLSLPTVWWLPTRAPFRIVRMLHELRRIRPALVHCNANSFAPVAVILGGYRRVLTIHGVSGHEAHLRTGRVAGAATGHVLIERYVHRNFPAFICISRYAAGVVGSQGVTFAIPNPVGSAFLGTQAGRHPDARPRLVFIGVLAPLKRPIDLLLAHIELLRDIPDLQTVFCGHAEDAGYAHNLKQRVADESIPGVQFIEHATQAETAQLLGGATVLVLPSAQENAPMVISEAMAVGLPVVATRVGGVPEMVEDGVTGLLYEPGDGAALTRHLRRLLVDASLRSVFGDAARRRAQARYAPSAVAQATVAAYRELLGEYAD